MSDISQTPPKIESRQDSDVERTKQVNALCSAAGVIAFLGLGALVLQPEWPVAVGVVAMALMASVAACVILKKNR